MRVVADTGPLISAADRRDPAHRMAAGILADLARDVVIPVPVLSELDHLLRRHGGADTARQALQRIADGERQIGYTTAGLLRRAAEIDAQYADLDLGFVDASVMAYAERHELPILTFDFADFRATEGADGPWRLAIDESTYAKATGGQPPSPVND